MQFVERPSDAEMARLLEKYGRIRRRIVDWNLQHVEGSALSPECEGEVVLLLIDSGGRLAAIRKHETSTQTFLLPTGRIGIGEGVEDAARREALEETGWSVVIDEIAALHQIRMRFKNWNLERWFFIVLCRLQGDGGIPIDTEEIAEVKLLELPGEIPIEWVRNQWYLWILKDGGLLHPHSFLLGKAPGSRPPGEGG